MYCKFDSCSIFLGTFLSNRALFRFKHIRFKQEICFSQHLAFKFVFTYLVIVEKFMNRLTELKRLRDLYY